MIKVLAFRKQIISRLLSSSHLGRLVFWISIAAKRVSLFWGSRSQRAVEYPWVLKQLRLLKKGGIVLDVGCAESLLSHELIARKYIVCGIDIREYPFKSKRVLFIKRNVVDTGIQSNIFDAIIAVSAIEHIGLRAYGQLLFDYEGDIKAMKELHRILKPGGIIFITTPYIGNELFRISQFQRNYNRECLTRLVKDFHTLKEEYFYPTYIKCSKRLIWMKLDREQIDKKAFQDPGLACLILEKPVHMVYLQ